MNMYITIVCILAWILLVEWPQRRRMQSYWGRVCTGFRW
jgi:hypothetical protein